MKRHVIGFDCPRFKDLDLRKDGDYDCAGCGCRVYDFREKTEEEFDSLVDVITEKDLCGVYRYDQVSDKSQLGWRSRLGVFRYKVEQNGGRKFALALLIGFMFLTGCSYNRGVCGGFGKKSFGPSERVAEVEGKKQQENE